MVRPHIIIYAYMLTKSEVLENVNPDLSDSEFIDKDPREIDIGTPMPGESEAGDAPTPVFGGDGFEGEGYQDVEEEKDLDAEGDGDFDEELAAELDQALEGSQGSSDVEGGSDEGELRDRDDEGSGEDEDDEGDEDDEIDSAETKRARKLLNEEIRDLEAAVDKKTLEIERSFNPLIRVSRTTSFCLLCTHLSFSAASKKPYGNYAQI